MEDIVPNNASEKVKEIGSLTDDFQLLNLSKPAFVAGFLFIAIIVAIVICPMVTQPQNANEHERIEVLEVAFKERMMSGLLPGVAKEAAIMCVGSRKSNDFYKFNNAPDLLLRALGKTFPKVMQASQCQDSMASWDFRTYVLESEDWQSNGDVYVAVAFHEGRYGDSLTYHIQKISGKWEIVETHVGWIT